jgi:serine/threonine-protein kinase
MFLDEARTAAGIGHANVALVFDVGHDDDTYWLAMEYLHGEPLREILRAAEERGVRVSPEIAARICADAAEGLHAAHELRGKAGQPLGLVHRNVSPQNLFVTYDGRVKVVDFGIAKVADRLAAQTGAGMIKGKLAYMSPEQFVNRGVDRRTDVFALGVVLWEMSTGRRLFKAETDLETLDRVRACEVPPPSSIVPGYPRELSAIVMRALARNKEERFPTARDLSRALQMFQARGGHFVGAEEIAGLVHALFAERIREREEHLLRAAEITSAGAPRRQEETPIRVEMPLVEEDEDMPTMVLRELPREVDLGRTIALPGEPMRAPSPIFAQHRPLPVAAPLVLAPLPHAGRQRALAIAGLALLTLAALALIASLVMLRG